LTIYLFVNPSAGNSDENLLAENLCQRLATRGIDVMRLATFDELTRLTPAKSTTDLLIVAGGDGTVNSGAEVAWRKGYQFLPLPYGTANDFCSRMGINQDVSLINSLIRHRPQQQVDIVESCISHNGHDKQIITLNAFHVGAGAELLKSLEANSETKKRWGKLGYVRQLISAKLEKWVGFKCQIEIEDDTEGSRRHWRGRAIEILVANSGQFGGGHKLPDACYDTGKIHLLVIKPASWFIILWYWLTFRWHNSWSGTPLVIGHGTHIKITAKPAQAISNDGDLVGTTPCTTQIHAGALTVISDGINRDIEF